MEPCSHGYRGNLFLRFVEECIKTWFLSRIYYDGQADQEDLVEYVCREWVDEVFLNIPESESYPSDLLDKFIEMGVVVHMKLAKSQNLLGKKQFVERLGTYTVLTTSINSVSRRQIVLKRMLDILGGLAGCIITGILCIFLGPAIYIQSPGPIFFKQTRVGKNGKMF